jgi:metallo-beta-lactamase family protein
MAALPRLRALTYGERREVAEGVTVRCRHAGHILGSATVELELAGDPPKRVLFSGDLGRFDAPILPDPEAAGDGYDALLVESTYGGRRHQESADARGPAEALAAEVKAAAERRGVLLIPAFAIGRTQEILFALKELEQAGAIPELPVYVDSPMAVDATPIFLAHREDHDDEMSRRIAAGEEPLRPARLGFVRSVGQSKALNDKAGPFVVISASGMATGGRVLHHLARRLPEATTTVLLVGFQAAGTRGAQLQQGAQLVKIHGEQVPVKARVATISGFSAHADEAEIVRWLGTFARPPRMSFLVHGEPEALAAAQKRMDGMGWPAKAPAHLEEIPI